MGSLYSPETGARCSLSARHLIGRSRRCSLQLTASRASGEHATIWWDGARWLLRDLGSRNGTTVNGEALPPGQSRALCEGDALVFGGSSWSVASVSPPLPQALCLTDQRRVLAHNHLLALPDPEAPEVLVYRDAAGAWRMEQGWSERAVVDQEELTIGADRWRLQLPEPIAETEDATHTQAVFELMTLVFVVSSDEEHVTLTARTPVAAIDLGARSHHYFLLTLARARREDAAREELPESEHGWLHQEDLARMLAVSTAHLNLLTFRARRQLADADVAGAAELIERRVGSGMMRLGTARFEIA